MKTLKPALKVYIVSFAFLSIFLLSCGKKEKLALALEQAGPNRYELLKVIDHYKRYNADSLKLKAAYFLIENMPYHYSYDTTCLYRYRPVIEKICSLRIKGIPAKTIRKQVNPIIDSLVALYPLSYVYSGTKSDITSISSKYLINVIDQSFESYTTNPFKNRISFNNFLEYILPYRVQDGYSIEEWRPYFKGKYPVGKVKNSVSVPQLCDSLLFNFRDIKLEWKLADKFPYLRLNDYLKSMMTHCPQKCWFNCLLFRSSGIPATTDFVPVSRVHPAGHEWNIVQLKDTFYVIEPFWADSIRYLRSFYGREKSHPNIGPIRFPKIYRKTFKITGNELLDHAASSGEEIPPFFKDPFFKDVTSEYFKTFNLESPVLKNIDEVSYAYACVMSTNLTWIPVDFGKIKNKKISFHSLGSENVYLPACYKLKSLVPAAYPILINKNGSASILCPDKLHSGKINLTHTAFQRPDEQEYKRAFIGAAIEGSDNRNFDSKEVLYRFSKACEPGTYRISIQPKKKYRYVRLILPKSKIVLHEIAFFSKENKREKDVRGRLISSNPADSTLFQRITDKDLLTGSAFTSLGEDIKPSDSVWVGYDFNRPVAPSSFGFYFVLGSNFKKGGTYELLYWDFGWKSLGQKKVNTIRSVSFEHVPEKALLIIRNRDTGSYSRIFTYSAGKQLWN